MVDSYEGITVELCCLFKITNEVVFKTLSEKSWCELPYDMPGFSWHPTSPPHSVRSTPTVNNGRQ